MAKKKDQYKRDSAATDRSMKQLREAGYIVNLFHADDISEMDEGKGLTPEQIEKVRDAAEDLGADDGVNWDNLALLIDAVKRGEI